MLAIALVLAPTPVARVAAPASEEAPLPDDPAERGGVLIGQGRFAEAAAAFAEAYEATGDSAFLFSQALAMRRAGNCNGTIAILQRYLETSPPEADAEAARGIIGECRDVLGDDADPEPQPDPADDPTADPVPAPDPGPPVDDKPRRAPWSKDVTGGVLLGTGLFATVAGVGTFAGSFAMASDRDETEAEYEARDRRVRTTAGIGIGLMVVGGGLLVGSVVRYVIVARRGGSRTNAAAVASPLTWRF